MAWANLKVQRAEKLTEPVGESENDIWEWLWENTEYSRTALMQRIGLPISESGPESKLRPLIGKRILYSEGTVNSFVLRYLRERVVKLFDTKPKRPFRKAE